MPEAFNLRRMLEEITDDEKVSTSRRTKVSQADIQKLLAEKMGEGQGSRLESDLNRTPGTSPSMPVEESSGGEGKSRHPVQGGRHQSDASEGLGPAPAEDIPPGQAGTEKGGIPNQCGGRPILRISDGVLPARIILKYRIIPLRLGERVLELAMENPDDLAVIYDVEILTGRRVEPVKVRREVLERSLRLFSVDRMVAGFEPTAAREQSDAGLLPTLLELLVVSEGSDLLITQGSAPWIKTTVHMESTGLPAVTALDCVRCAKSLMTEERWERFLSEGVVTFSHQSPVHGRFRVQVFKERGAPSLVIRRIPNPMPTIEELGLPSWVDELALSSSGFVIISGPAGHGKTTTLHAMVHRMNTHRACHIVTLEDPVEVLHRSLKSQIIQREIDNDVGSRREGIRQAMRQGAHVIVVGELNSSGVFLQALAAAESGRLVLATFEASASSNALHQLIHAVPSPLHPHVLSMMESTSVVIVAQKLVSSGLGSGVRADCRKLESASELDELRKSLG